MERLLYVQKLFMNLSKIIMDDKEQLNILDEDQRPEVIADFSNISFGKLKININYKDKLSKKKLLEKEDSNNVLFLFMDNLSKVQFYR